MVCISSLLFSCKPINVVFQGGCCHDHVIHVTHHKVPIRLRHSGQSLSHQSSKSGRGVAQAKGHHLLLVQPQFTCKSGFFLSFFRRGISQKAEPESIVVKNLASPNFERLSSIRGIGYASFMSLRSGNESRNRT